MIAQILTEVLSISIVAVTLALYSGTFLASGISRQMLEIELINRQPTEEQVIFDRSTEIPFALEAFNPGRMTNEEMMDAFTITMDSSTIIMFYGAAIGTIVLSTVLPMIYIMRLNPKKIMM